MKTSNLGNSWRNTILRIISSIKTMFCRNMSLLRPNILGRSGRENRVSLICHAAHCQIKYIVLIIIFLKLAKMKEMDEHTAGKPRTEHWSSEQTSRFWHWHLLGDIGGSFSLSLSIFTEAHHYFDERVSISYWDIGN